MVNKWIGIGRLTAQPDARTTQDGAMVTNFSIACSEKWKDKDGNQQEKTEFVRVVTFRKLAEICQKYLTRGKLIYIDGKLQTRTWDDKDGVKRYITEVVANDMKMLEKKEVSSGSGSYQGDPVVPEGDVPF